MSQRPFWRWLLRDKEWTWMSRRPLRQYLLLHWARAVLAVLIALAIVAALLRSFTPFSFLVWYIVGATLGTIFFSRRRWRRGQAQVHPKSRASTPQLYKRRDHVAHLLHCRNAMRNDPGGRWQREQPACRVDRANS